MSYMSHDVNDEQKMYPSLSNVQKLWRFGVKIDGRAVGKES